MADFGMSPEQCKRFEIWRHIASVGIKAVAEPEDIAEPLVMHVIGPSKEPAKHDLVVVFEGLDTDQQEGLESVLAPWFLSGLEGLEGGGRPADEVTLRITWKRRGERGCPDALLSIDWEGSHLELPVMVSDQPDNYYL